MASVAAPQSTSLANRNVVQEYANFYSLATPYFNIWVGGPSPQLTPFSSARTDSNVHPIEKSVNILNVDESKLLGYTKPVSINDYINQALSSYSNVPQSILSKSDSLDLMKSVVEVSVKDSVVTSDTFSIKIIDPDIKWIRLAPSIFNLGDVISVEIGYAQSTPAGVPGYENKITGRITKIGPIFPEDGVPYLVISGVNMGDQLRRVPALNISLLDITNALIIGLDKYIVTIAELVGLKATIGVTVDTGVSQNDPRLNVDHLMMQQGERANYYNYLSRIASLTSCTFFIKGTTLYFRSVDNLIKSPATFPLEYRTGLKNCLSLSVASVGDDSAGFMLGGYGDDGSALSKTVASSSDIFAEAVKNLPGLASTYKDASSSTTDAGTNPDNVGTIAKLTTSASAKQQSNTQNKIDAATGKVMQRIIAPLVTAQGSKGQSTAAHQSRIQATAANLIWFIDATANAIGDINLRAGTKVALRATDETPVAVTPSQDVPFPRSSSIDGPWFVLEVEHTISSGTGYRCALTLKQYWDLTPYTKAQEASAQAYTSLETIYRVNMGKSITAPIAGTNKPVSSFTEASNIVLNPDSGSAAIPSGGITLSN